MDTNPSPKNATARRRGPGKPFKKGEGGRPPGTRNRTTLAVEAMLDGEGEKLARKAVELALAGDVTALRLCLDRVAPCRRERPVNLDLPDAASVADLPAVTQAILRAIASGEIAPGEAASLATSVSSHQRSLELTEIEARLALIEGRLKSDGK